MYADSHLRSRVLYGPEPFGFSLLGPPSGRRSRRLPFAAVFLAGLLFAGIRPAHADPQDEARRHFATGLELVRQGDYEAGVEQFLLAYDILPHPSVLYNVARAHADAGNFEEALDYFERYLASDPEDRVEVEGMMDALVARMEAIEAQQHRPAEAPSTAAGGTGGPAVTSQEVETLHAVAEQLEALARELESRGPAGGPSAEVETGSATAESGDASEEGTEGGEPPPPDALDLVEDLYERVVVTASRYGQDPLEAPSAVTVLTREDIRMSPATTVADLLRQVPGMDVMQLAAGQSEVSIRGFNRRLSNKVLVLVDGRSTYLDFIGSTLWGALPITLEEIDRIEIIRGAGSAMYGANAFAGVVNIITHAPGGPGVDNQVTVSGGTRDTRRASALLTGRRERLAWRASAGTTTLGRWARELDPAARPDEQAEQEQGTPALDMHRGNLQLDWRLPQEGFASLSGGWSEGLDEFYAIGTLGDFYADLVQTHLRGDAGYGPLHVRTFWNHFEADTGSWYHDTWGNEVSGQVDSDVYDVEARLDTTFGENDEHRISAAVGYRRKEIAWSFLDADHAENHFNGYIQDESRFGPVAVTASIRVDQHPLLEGITPSPRLAVVTRVAEGRAIRVNGGTAFRTPTFMESYLSLDQPLSYDALMVRSSGDTSLRAENILSLEAGYLDRSSASWRGEINGYFNRVTDLIELGPLYGTDPAEAWDKESATWLVGETFFENSDVVYRAWGGEAEWEYFGLPGLDLYLNYALEMVMAEEDGEVHQDRATPVHRANGGVIYRSPWRTDLSMHAHWIDDQVWTIRSFDSSGEVLLTESELPGWVLISNRIVIHPLGDDRWSLSLDAWNWPALLESVGPHREHPLGQQVGARVYGSVSTRF